MEEGILCINSSNQMCLCSESSMLRARAVNELLDKGCNATVRLDGYHC